MKKFFFLGLILNFFFTSAACSQQSIHSKQINRIGVMTFNVENLFDTLHDKGKNDHTFLPLQKKQSKKHREFCHKIKRKKWRIECLELNWSKENLNKKMQNLAASILQVNKGRGPDILILQEIENLNVLNQLHKNYLQKANYRKPIFIEGPSRRGIDVAILSRLRIIGTPILHRIPFQDMPEKRRKDSRGILQANLQLSNSQIITIYANHFPAPFHPRKYRIQGFQFLNKLQNSLPKDRISIAAGDFNVPLEENSKYKILDKYVKKNWIAAHKFCKGCKGTAYYPPKDSWSFLDMILLSKNLDQKSKWSLDKQSIQIANKADSQKTKTGTPKRYNPKTKEGVSDHWPLYLEIIKKQIKAK